MGRDIWGSLPLREYPDVQARSEIWTLILNTTLSWGFLWWRVQRLCLRVHLPEAQSCKVVPFPSSELYRVLSISGGGNQRQWKLSGLLCRHVLTFQAKETFRTKHSSWSMVSNQEHLIHAYFYFCTYAGCHILISCVYTLLSLINLCRVHSFYQLICLKLISWGRASELKRL